LGALGGDTARSRSQRATMAANRNLATAVNSALGNQEMVFYLTNNLPYAVPVEEGTDRTPPRRMLARAIQSVSQR
jgi:hypothetical protein